LEQAPVTVRVVRAFDPDVRTALTSYHGLSEEEAKRYLARWQKIAGLGWNLAPEGMTAAKVVAYRVMRYHEQWLATQSMRQQIIAALIQHHRVTLWRAQQLMNEWRGVVSIDSWQALYRVETPESAAELIAQAPPRTKD
jgi:hypothetical protein